MKNILATILIGGAIGIFYLLVSPTYQEIQTMQTEKADYDKALNNSAAVKERQAILSSKYNGMNTSDVSRLEKFLPDSIDNIRLFIEIDKIAQKNNMTIKSPSITESQPAANVATQAIAGVIGVAESPYGTGNMSFSVTGTYGQFLSFLGNLESSLRLIDVTAVSLAPATNESTKATVEDTYEFKTSINTYWLK